MSAPGWHETFSPRRYSILLCFICVYLCSSVANSSAVEPDDEADEQALRAVRLSADGPSLLAVFRKRTPDEDSQAHIKTLIEQLGSDSFTEREEASEELASFSVEATGLLRAALQHKDLEIRRRVRDALAVIEKNDLPAEVLIAALHMLGRRKPAQLVEVLLDYVPHAVNADVTEGVCSALAASSGRDGAAAPRLVRALTAASPIQRGVAGAALCRGGAREHRPAVRRLLRDPDAHVRHRVALALLESREKAAVPVLIDLLAQMPEADAERIESLLLQLAGETAPKASLDEDRGKYRAAWADWWRLQGDALDLAKIELVPQWRGYTLAVLMVAIRGRGARAGAILELDAQGRTRWQIQGLFRPVDAQVLDDKRILVTEYSPGQVTERNPSGDIIRRIDVSDPPLEARRLPNGNTFVVTRSQCAEVDRNGKEIWKVRPGITIAAACRLPRGELAICALTGEFVRLDHTGKILHESDISTRFRPYGTHIQALPNGHVLVPLLYDNKVVEVDKKGRVVWSAHFAQPASAQRLPNGRTLVAGYGSNRIAELDKNGREVKSISCPGRLMCINGR